MKLGKEETDAISLCGFDERASRGFGSSAFIASSQPPVFFSKKEYKLQFSGHTKISAENGRA